MIDLEAYDPLVSMIRRCGGTGRRAGLKIRCPQGRGSSTLPTGTILLELDLTPSIF